ncbi:MAG TPA: nuclear transport factor 2 family protein [Gemmatimonadales bacterium]
MLARTSLVRAAILSLLLVPTSLFAQGIEPDRARLRTALDDLQTFRTEYAEAFNRKDAAAVSAMYADDAIVVQADGTMLVGSEAIGKSMATEASSWPHGVIASDTTRVYGSTAVDIGTWTMHEAGGGESVNRYAVVLRRGMSGWKLTHVILTPTK